MENSTIASSLEPNFVNDSFTTTQSKVTKVIYNKYYMMEWHEHDDSLLCQIMDVAVQFLPLVLLPLFFGVVGIIIYKLYKKWHAELGGGQRSMHTEYSRDAI